MLKLLKKEKCGEKRRLRDLIPVLTRQFGKTNQRSASEEKAHHEAKRLYFYTLLALRRNTSDFFGRRGINKNKLARIGIADWTFLSLITDSRRIYS